MKKYLFYLTALFCSIGFTAWSQTSMGNGTLNQCGGTFLDPGGAGNYSDNSNFTQTICSPNPGECITLQFTSFQIESGWDFLYIYDGSSTASPQVAGSPFTGSGSPGQITATSGCLTLVFTSDGSVVDAGWIANVICTPCGSPPPPPPGPITAGDCSQAVNICTNSSFQIDPNGSGNTVELTVGTFSNPSTNPASANSGCLLSGELNSTWMIVNIASSGTLEFSFGAPGQNTNCYDWIMWPYNAAACNAIFNNTLAPIRCNYNGNCAGFTGVAATLPAGGDASNFEPVVNVNCGEQYLICLSNWSNASTQVPLNFFGTATIACSTFVPITVNSDTICPGTSTTLTANGGTTYNWNTGATTASITVSPAATTVYTVTGTGSCGSGTATATVTVLPAGDPSCGCTATASNTGAYCPGQTIQLNASGGGTYSWSGPGGFTSALQNPTISSATTAMSGVYTVTVTAGANTCTATTTVTVDPDPVPTSSNTGPYCEGTTIDLSSGGGGTYSWSGPNGFTSTSQNPSISGSTTAMGGVYTVTVTLGSCTASSTTSVTVNAAPVAAANNSGPYCIGDPINLSSSGGGTYAWSGPNAFSSTAQNPSIAAATAAENGVYTVTVTSAASCTATATTSVTVNPPPTPAASNSGPFCENGTISLTASGGSTYSWSGPAGFTSANQNPSIGSATTAMDGVYTVTVSVGSCTATATTTVIVNAAPVPTAGNTGAYCAGDQIDLSASGGTTYTWSGPNAYSSSVQNPSIASSTTAEAGVYTVTVTDANNCSATATTSVTVNALPVPVLSSNGPLCEGDSLAAICSNGTSWTWSGPNGFSSTNDTVIINPVTLAEAGTYSISVSDANGCSDTSSVNVAVNALPVVTASAVAICVGDTGTLTANGAVNYTWSAGTTPATGATVDASPSATANYTVTGVDANGCQDTGVVTLTVNALPLVTVTSASICPGMSDTLVASGANTYSWSAGANPLTADQDSVSVSPAVTTTYTVTGTDANGCGDTAVATVNVNNAGLTLTLSGNTVLCLGDSTMLTANGGTTYVWNPGALAGDTITVTPSVTTDYIVSASDANGCTGTDTITVNVAPTMTTATTGTNISCNSACDGQASVNVTPASGPFATYTYSWNNGATTAATPATLCPGTYTVTITDGAGCITTDTVSVTEPAMLTTSSASTDVLCNGASTGTGNITATGGTPAYTYTWSNGASGATQNNLAAGTYSVVIADANSCLDTVQITITQPTALTATLTPTNLTCVNPAGAISSSVSGGTPGYSYSWAPSGSGQNPSGLTAGTYTLTLTDTNNCVLIQTVAVTSNTVAPGANAGSNAILNCGPNASLPLSGSASASGATYSWSGPGGFTSSSANPTITAPGIYTLTTTDPANGCTSTDTVEITQSYIDASFTYNPGSGTWPLSVAFTNTSDNATMYGWSFGNGDASTQMNDSATYLAAGTYTVEMVAINSYGCVDTAYATIIVFDPTSIIIPNVFTPNGDGKNDVFEIKSTGLAELHVDIFDRWGLKMAEITSPNGVWTGKTSGGADVADGTYFYMVKAKGVDGEEVTQQGYLLLAR